LNTASWAAQLGLRLPSSSPKNYLRRGVSS
jgi:hypothetical protein